MKTTILILSFILTMNLTAQTTYVPDDNFENYLETHGMGNGIANDNYVTTANINTVTSLYINFKNISDLTGIEDFTALTDLRAYNNNLTDIDISSNVALQHFSCSNNQITSLDVSNNPNLTYLACHHNQLTELNVKNGHNTIITHFAAQSNPNLTCIEVDDAAWSTTNWTSIDATASFSEDCNLSAEEYDLQNAFNVYPNPAKDVINITNDSEEPITSMQLFNILGESIYNSDKFQSKINIAKLKDGMYLLKIVTKTGSITKKIIISK